MQKNMRRIAKIVAAGSLAAGFAAEGAAEPLTAETAEVLVAPAARESRSVAWFAAGEMTNFLSRAFGKTVPLVTAPTPGKTSVVVGTNAWSEAAGVDVAGLPRDGFIVKSVPGRVFVAGRDMEGTFTPAVDYKGGEKATLFGVYDFLEKYVGCRFYFPGEMGEVVPHVESVAVPEGEYTEAPEFLERKVRYALGEWFEPVSKGQYEMNQALCHYRWRLQTRGIPCCHGLQHGHYLARFGKTHPEYFCQRKDGTRMNDEEGSFPSPSTYRGQYCHTSAIWDEIYKDARSYFLGEGPEVRGMMAERDQRVVPGHEWRWQAAHGMYYDVMPQDNFQRCWCEKCTEVFAKAKDPAQYATELVWGRVAECARRLIDEGVPGNLTMMSYNPYKNVPEFDIPTNVLVMVCSNGAWAKEKFQEADLRRLQAWNEKCGRKLHIWNNCGKHVCFNLNYVDMPGITPRAYGKYYKTLAPYIFGAYCDNQSEKFVYSALNYYVFSRLAWNSAVDVDALLGEYYRLMFGKGADAMRRFDEEMEDIWMNEIISTQVETALGPMNAGISTFELWSRVVDMKRIGRFEALFDEAARAVAPDSAEAKRIAFFRRQILGPMAVHAGELEPEGGVARELAAREARGAVSVLADFTPVEFNVTTTNKDVHVKSFTMKLKGGRRYRVSYFVSGENLDQYGGTPEQLRIAKMWGGVLGSVSCGGRTMATVGRGIRGTFKPVVQAFEFTAPGEDGSESDAEMKLLTYLTTGRARIDSLLVEELRGASAAVDLTPYAKVTGTGNDDTRTVVAKFQAKPDASYVFSCELRHPAGDDAGVVVMTLADMSMYTHPKGHGWRPFAHAFKAPRGKASSSCVLRQWHVPGDLEFRNVRVTEAFPRYRSVGGVELGFGESLDGNVYRYGTCFSRATHNDSRPMVAYSCGEIGDGTVKVQEKTDLSFVHEIGGRTMLSASVGIAVDASPDTSAAVVSVSRDGQEWTDVLSASNTGIYHAEVPASYLPAKRLFARIRKGPSGKFAKLRQYMFDAKVDGPAAFGFGATDYVDAGSGEVILSDGPMEYLDDVSSGLALGGAPDGVACWEQSSGRKVFRGRPVPTERGEALKIAAARNEEEAKQLVIRPDKPMEGVRVTAEMPAGIDVEVRRVGYLLIDVPMDSMGSRGLWPDPIFDQDEGGCDIAAGENQPFWVSAKPRRGTKAGTYRGRLKVTAARGAPEFFVPVEVRVFDFDLPDRMSCDTAFGLSFSTVFRYHHAKRAEDKAAITAKYLEMFSRHHISPYTPYSGVTAGTFTDNWTKTPDPADSEPVFSWDAWDAAISNALCNLNFNTFKLPLRGKGSSDPLSREPRRIRKINGVAETNALYEVYMERYLKAVESHIREKGWLDKAYVYSFDEPEAGDYDYMREDLERLRRYAPSLRRMVTMEPKEGLHGSVSLWCPITEGYDREAAHARQQAGDDLWWYITFSSRPPKVNEHVEHSGVDMRVWLWQTWLEKVQGVLIWETVCWTRDAIYPDPEKPQNPYEDAMVWTGKRPWNSGEGRYIYPPEECFRTKDPVVAGPVDSIRFEMLREGLEDFEYFAMLNRMDPGSPLLSVPPEVTSSLDDYSTDPSGMEEHRMRLAEAIERAAARQTAEASVAEAESQGDGL